MKKTVIILLILFTLILAAGCAEQNSSFGEKNLDQYLETEEIIR